VAFGEGQAILAGNAMLVAAIQTLQRSGEAVLTHVLDAVQWLISGQSSDLALEQRADAQLAEVLEMERGKTAALIAVALGAGARAGGADELAVARLQRAGEQVGLAFQLVDDVLGVVGDPAVTGKSASSDVRAGKSSAPIVAAARGEGSAGAELRAALAAGVPNSEEEVARIRGLVEAAGGVAWATEEADRLLATALAELDELALPGQGAVAEIAEVARYLVTRDR
jgi:geranylgeranyl diphosphate synthase type I